MCRYLIFKDIKYKLWAIDLHFYHSLNTLYGSKIIEQILIKLLFYK